MKTHVAHSADGVRFSYQSESVAPSTVSVSRAPGGNLILRSWSEKTDGWNHHVLDAAAEAELVQWLADNPRKVK